MRAVACFLFAILPTGAAAQATGDWLCIADQSTGFSNHSGTWRSVDFNAGTRYIIKRSQRQGVAWEVQEFGKPALIPTAICKADFNQFKLLFCEGLGSDFRFNAATGRFLNTYLIGYYSYVPGQPLMDKDGADTPSMEIGTCSAL